MPGENEIIETLFYLIIIPGIMVVK